jgi:hypothetical protein
MVSKAELEENVERLLKALQDIVKHQDSWAGTMAKFSTTRKIAAIAIKEVTGEDV